MNPRFNLLPNPDIRDALTGVAKTIVDPPPAWLIVGLEHFSYFVSGDPITSEEEKDYRRIIARMHDAAACLIKFLPMYQRLPLGMRRPDDVAAALNVLPRIRDDLARNVNTPSRGGGQKPNEPRKVCAAVIIEAWRITHDGKPEPYSRNLWDACTAYWQACSQGYRPGANWERDAEAAVADNHEWIRQIFEALIALHNQQTIVEVVPTDPHRNRL
jgi:hypothetical protein